jgi:hypothetical protein
VLVDETLAGEEVMNISPFACAAGDSLKDCATLKQRFTDIGSNSFVSANGITFYNLSETITWAAFHPSGTWGYYVTPKDEKQFAAFVNLMSFVDEAAFAEAINQELPLICKDLDYSIEAVDDVSYTYEDNGIVKAVLTAEADDGASLICTVAIRLGNILQITPLGFTAEGGTGIVPEEDTDTVDIEENDVEDENEDEDIEEKEAVTPPSETTTTVPENWEENGWFRYSSVRGYNVYFSSKSISYAGEILDTATDLGVDGLTCTYKVNVIQWARADDVDTNPDVAIYECVGTTAGTSDLQKVGEVGTKVFLAEWYTTKLGDMSIIVE